jgi:hypothetical protein
MDQPFSIRIGAEPLPLQIDTVDEKLRSDLWNLIQEFIPANPTLQQQLVARVAVEVLRHPIDSLPYDAKGFLFHRLMEFVPWYEFYNCVE